MRTKFLAAVLFAIIVQWGCKNSQQENINPLTETPIVKTVVAQEDEYIPTLSYSGTVFANREANLGAALPGKVEKIYFKEGDYVRKGELIVELSDEMLTQAEVENQAIRKDYERVKRLKERGSISEMEYDHIKAQLEASDAKTEMIRKNTRVFAPFSGTIVERMMEEGEIYFINPGLDPGYSMRSGIVRLMQLNPVKVKFDVNEKDLAFVKKDLNTTISLDALPNKTFSGAIASVKPMLSTLTRTASAEIILENSSENLKPGMFARITVQLPVRSAVFVPLICVLRLPGTGEDFVYVVDDIGSVNRVVVKRLYTLGDKVAVTGVEKGQMVISEGMNRVSHGQKVEVRN